MKLFARRFLPYSAAKILWGDRKRWGLEVDQTDPCWTEWIREYSNFYDQTQREGIGIKVNDAGYSVMNKIDLLNQEPRIEIGHDGTPTRIWLSAMNSQGLDQVLEVLSQTFADQVYTGELKLPPELSRLRALLYKEEAVLNEKSGENGEYLLSVSIRKRILNSLLSKESLDIETLESQ